MSTKARKTRTLPAKKCERCQETFTPTGSNCRRCPPCRLKHQREQARLQHERHPDRKHGTGKGYNQKGSNNNAWRGGSSPSYYRSLCFAAWGNKCMGCPAPATIAHHRDEERSNNVKDNLTPLCRRCHQLLHGCVLNLPKGKVAFHRRACPTCPRMFMPTGPRGVCPKCRATGMKPPGNFKEKECSNAACRRQFMPTGPRSKKCPSCRG